MLEPFEMSGSTRTSLENDYQNEHINGQMSCWYEPPGQFPLGPKHTRSLLFGIPGAGLHYSPLMAMVRGFLMLMGTTMLILLMLYFLLS
jgi:hypothetical protein